MLGAGRYEGGLALVGIHHHQPIGRDLRDLQDRTLILSDDDPAFGGEDSVPISSVGGGIQ